MHDLMRKYKKQILWVVIILISVSFGILGTFSLLLGRGGGPGQQSQDQVGSLAVVNGEPIVVAEFRDAMDRQIDRLSRYRPGLTYADLAADGTAERIINEIIGVRLLEAEAAALPDTFDTAYLQERLKDTPQFKDENGNFDVERYNSWVTYMSKSSQSWNTVYENLAAQLRRDILLNRVTASARVLESDLRKKFVEGHTKIKLKYAAIEPAINPTPEQIKAKFDEDPMRYAIPEKRKAEFVSISLLPPKPALIDELAKRARAGEDFAALAKEHSQGEAKEEGGDLGWKTDAPDLPAQLKPVFALPVGAVSDPVVDGNGWYYIYKVEEEKKSEVTGQRDVKLREIVLRPELSEEDRKAREDKATALMEKADDSGDLVAAATEAGLQVQTTGLFSTEPGEIENIAPGDEWAFRGAMTKLNKGLVSDVIKGRTNLYVAKVVETVEAIKQPFETVQEKVKKDTIEGIRLSPEHVAASKELAEEIAEKVDSLDAIKTAYPDVKVEVKETEFAVKEYRYGEGPPWNPQEVFDVVADAKPGEVVGPIKDFLTKYYLVSVVSKTEPDGKMWEEKWPEEKEQMRDMELSMAKNKRLQDYLQYLRDRDREKWYIDADLLMEIVLPPKPAEEAPAEEGAADGEAAAASDDAPAAAEADAPEAASDAPAEEAKPEAATEEAKPAE